MDALNIPEIGPVLRRQRKSCNLTLEQVAALSGVSKSMLSQIERGKVNPTFAVLWSLTHALQIDLGDLVASASRATDVDPIEIVPAVHTPEISSADGACRLRILSPPRLSGETEWYEIEIAPSGCLDSSPHPVGAFEHFTAFSDGFEITSGGVTRVLRKGETARYPVDVAHRIANVSGRRIRGLLVVLYR